MKKNYAGFYENSGKFFPVLDRKVEKLKPGAYIVHNSPMEGLFLERTKITSDFIVDIPGTAYDQVVAEFEHFLKPETKNRFNKLGVLYKRSSLLFGPPGTGKTCIVNRISELAINSGAIVLFNPNPSLLPAAYQAIEDAQPESLVLVIFEEIEEIINFDETQLLLLLDGAIQKDNIIYLATTNHIEQIPQRILRPGRFSSIVKVDYLTEEGRARFINAKTQAIKDDVTPDFINDLTKVSESMTIDEITELIRGRYCLSIPLEELAARIKSRPKGKPYNTEIEEEF